MLFRANITGMVDRPEADDNLARQMQ